MHSRYPCCTYLFIVFVVVSLLLCKHLPQMEAERKISRMQLSEEAVEREGKRMKLLEMEEQLRVQRNLLDTDRKTLESFAEEIQKRSRELDETCKVRNVVAVG